MDKRIIEKIGIPSRVINIELCNGGMNTSWKVVTETRSYQIKKLSEHYNSKSISSYIEADSIGKLFQDKGINSVTAIQINNKIAHYINGSTYFVYPWLDGDCKEVNDLTKPQSQQIGQILYQLHSVNLTKKSINQDWNDVKYPDNYWKKISSGITDSFFHAWINEINCFDDYSKLMYQARESLKHNLCISHRDLREGNLIWYEGNISLIDWECAGPVNPQLELFGIALLWSGVEDLKYNENIFNSIIDTYTSKAQMAMTICKEDCFWSSIGDNLWWFNHNLAKLKNNNDVERATIESERSLRTINFLMNHKERICSSK